MDIAPAPPQPDDARALSPAPVAGPVSAPPARTSAGEKQAYPPPAAVPTQLGPEGIRFDFNLGARVVLPHRTDGGHWRVRLRDLDTGNVLFESENRGAFVNSAKRWFVRFGVEVWSLDEGGAGEPRPVLAPVLTHDYDARGREVLVHFPVGTLGGVMAGGTGTHPAGHADGAPALLGGAATAADALGLAGLYTLGSLSPTPTGHPSTLTALTSCPRPAPATASR